MRLVVKIYCFVMFCILTNTTYANVSIPFEMINGLILVEAEVNGKLGNYIIDSGSNGILLNGKPQYSELSYQTLNTTIEGSEMKIESFKVGDFEVGELLGFSTDLSNLESYLDKRISGILGCSIFTPNSLIFDFSNLKMIISDQNLDHFDLDGLSSLSFSIVEELPLVQISIEGNAYDFILDTGASTHFIDNGIVEKYQNEIELTGVEKSIFTAGGEGKISKEYSISDCILGTSNTTITAFEKDFKMISEILDREISGLLSLSKLSTGIVYFDLKSHKLYYSENF